MLDRMRIAMQQLDCRIIFVTVGHEKHAVVTAIKHKLERLVLWSNQLSQKARHKNPHSCIPLILRHQNSESFQSRLPFHKHILTSLPPKHCPIQSEAWRFVVLKIEESGAAQQHLKTGTSNDIVA